MAWNIKRTLFNLAEKILPEQKFQELRFFYKTNEYQNYNKRQQSNSHPNLDAIGIKHIKKLEITKYKSSETLFILGSGASINEISPEQWEVIRSCDSFAFNHWYFHDYVPTYYMFEISEEPIFKAAVINNLNKIAYRYKEVPKIIKYKPLNGHLNFAELSSSLFEDLYIMDYLPFKPPNLRTYSEVLGRLNSHNFFAPGTHPHNIIWTRASLTFVINFAVLGGYKHIILAGIDLNNTDYFFRTEGFQIPPGLKELPNYQAGKIHKTNDETVNILTMSAIIPIINEKILKPNQISLSVLNKSSALYPKIPSFEFSQIKNFQNFSDV